MSEGGLKEAVTLRRKLNLSSVQATRRSLGRIIRLFDRDELEVQKYRALVYGLSHMLAFFKTETEQELLARIEKLEEKLSAEID